MSSKKKLSTSQRGLTRRLLLAAPGAIASSLLLPLNAFAAEPLVLIVNKKNSATPSRAELTAIFTTRKLSWGAGKRIVPFNFPPKHSIRTRFDRSLLNMAPDDVARYWIDRRIRGGSAPPKQVGNAQLIVRLVAKLNGAIGYVPRSAVNDSVRVLREL